MMEDCHQRYLNQSSPKKSEKESLGNNTSPFRCRNKIQDSLMRSQKLDDIVFKKTLSLEKENISNLSSIVFPANNKNINNYVKILKEGKLTFKKDKKAQKKAKNIVSIQQSQQLNKKQYTVSIFSSKDLGSIKRTHPKQYNLKQSTDDESFDYERIMRKISSSLSMQRKDITCDSIKISDFQLGELVGSGKFADVFLCRHKQTHTIYSLKKILKSTIVENKMVSQFVTELKIQYRLNHPNIVKLYAHFDDEYHVFMLMEYAPGGNLMGKIHNTEAYTANVMEQIIKAVQYTHSKMIVHRDIKPENIVLFFDNTVKLSDFGLSAILQSKQDFRISFCGTLEYIAPEMKDKGLYNTSVDIWALGILCYQILFGKAPLKEQVIAWKKKGGRQASKWNWKIKYPYHTSVDALAFMTSLLKQNPRERSTLQSALSSNFISKKQHLKALLQRAQSQVFKFRL